MKKILIIMLVLGSYLFANSLSKIESMSAQVKENTIVNKNKKEKTYSFTMKYPDKVYKEMISPKINAGEKYIYNGTKKLVYYPLLKDKFIEEIDDNENYILQAIKAIKSGKSKMTLEKKEIKELKLDDGVRILFYDYKKIDGLNFPHKVEIYEGKSLYSTLVFSGVKLNQKVEDKIFNLK